MAANKPADPNAMMAEMLLSCGHQRRYSPPPRRGDVLLCVMCDRPVTVVYGRGWKLICESADCAVARGYGVRRKMCHEKAVQHAGKYGHRVGLFYDNKPYGIATADGVTKS